MHWKNNHIKFDEIPSDTYINFDWKEDKRVSIDFSKCRYLIIWHHSNKEKTFDNLPDIPNLEYLEINWSSSTSLIGLSKFKKLKRLELHCCTKLESLDGIEILNKGIEYIHINQSKKLKGHPRITLLKSLRTLCFNDCGEIDNLYFIMDLPYLNDFRFVNTNIVNGDLKPLIKHSRIRNASFLNKRHYTHKNTDIDKLIASR